MASKISKAYENKQGGRNYFFIFSSLTIMLLFVWTMNRYFSNESKGPTIRGIRSFMNSKDKVIKSLTWNVAAINNNPFEYWITNDDNNYNDIMKKVSEYIKNPGVNDIEVKNIFTDEMFSELELEMKKIGWNGINETRILWEKDYKNRKVISEFIKDPILGKKRLASMPDRLTNTINTANGEVILRPTVINCYSEDINTNDKWWKQWKNFFFDKEILIKKNGTENKTKIYQMLQKIKKSKYPTITIEEEIISIPLQTLCIAIFDIILVDMMNKISSDWQPIRSDICLKLNKQKNDRTIEILYNTYHDNDIMFLQEVAGNFKTFTENKKITTIFDVFQANNMDTDRDQNSFILLKKGKYKFISDVTEDVINEYKKNSSNQSKLPIVNGDLIAIIVIDIKDNVKYLLASFHGDTNGLATIPVVNMIYHYATLKQPDIKLLFGMDANTYTKPEKDQQGVTKFAEFYTSLKLNSCYGPNPNPYNFTTFHARTHLQTQLNKAISIEEKDIKGDKNPKDFILFFSSDFEVVETLKDNTGDKQYIEGMVFPTLKFPSDHGITSTILKETLTK